MFGVEFNNSMLTASAKMDDLVNYVMSYLELLNGDQLQNSEAAVNQDVKVLSTNDTSATTRKLQASAVVCDAPMESQSKEEVGDERKKALRIAKTGNH